MSENAGSRFHDHETIEARLRRRFIRRWKRRAQALAPLLGIPLVFGALALSMDLVRYVPEVQAVKAQASDTRPRPVQSITTPKRKNPLPPTSERTRPSLRRSDREAQINLNALDPTSLSLDLANPRDDVPRVPVTSFSERAGR